MRIRPVRVLPLFAYGLAAAMGCAGAGTPTVTGAGAKGGSTTGAAGTSSGGMAGTSSGNSGTSGRAGTTGSAGSVVAGTGGASAGAAGTTGAGAISGGGTGGVSSTAGTTGAAGSGLVTGTAGTSGAAGTGGGCQMAKITYEPKIPTVYILVDRSGSMFDCLATTTNVEAMCGANNQGSPMDTSWYKLKEATRSVLKSLEHDVHFGFATIWGQNPAGGGMCPPLQGMVPQKVAPKEDNADEIMTLYDSLAFQPNTTQQGMKFETPASETLQIIGDELVKLTSPGDKYILFITDGQPDYCDDSNSLCAPDSVVGHIQRLKAMNITTIVMGLQANISDLPKGILQAFANAGVGEPTVAPLRGTGTTSDFYDQCNSVAGWKADLTFLGKTDARGTTLGTYATTAGPTTPFSPSAADQTQIVTQLSQALAGVKSCSFDLNDVNGKMIKVDTMKLAQAHVLIQGMEVGLSATDGWNVDAAAPSTLVFSGTACTKWRMPSSTMIDLQFPCGSIIFE